MTTRPTTTLESRTVSTHTDVAPSLTTSVVRTLAAIALLAVFATATTLAVVYGASYLPLGTVGVLALWLAGVGVVALLPRTVAEIIDAILPVR